MWKCMYGCVYDGVCRGGGGGGGGGVSVCVFVCVMESGQEHSHYFVSYCYSISVFTHVVTDSCNTQFNSIFMENICGKKTPMFCKVLNLIYKTD